MRRHLEDLFQAIAAALGGLLLVWSGVQLRSGTAPGEPGTHIVSLADLQEAAGLAACGVGLLLLGWWTVGFAAAFLSAALARGGRIRAAHAVGRLSPGFLRRLAAAALGIQLLAVPVPAALAASAGSSAGSSLGSPLGSSAVDPQWQPERDDRRDGAGSRQESAVDPAWKPSPGPAPASLLIPPGSRTQAPARESVTVMAGDTLWGLAAAQLGSLATDAEVAGHWPRWYELNRLVVGPDPNVLLPGQILSVPPLPAG